MWELFIGKVIEKKFSSAINLAIVAVMTALLECAKLLLSLVPNVELVTLLSAVFGAVFGPLGVLSTLIFVVVEYFIWGFGTWLVSYAIHWPLVALTFWLCAKQKWFNKFWATGLALVFCIGFSFLTSLVDVGLFTGVWQDFWHRFFVYYLRGIVFYLVQLATNLVVFLSLYDLIKNSLTKIKTTFN